MCRVSGSPWSLPSLLSSSSRNEQVLAAADDLGDGAPGEVGGGVLRHPEVGVGQRAAGQRVVQAAAGEPDGVSLGHGVTIVSGTDGMMHACRTLAREVSLLSRTVEPVTVTVARRVAPGREPEFERWYDGIISAASRSPGFLGSGILRPHTADQDWHVVYRFADPESLARWESSEVRAEWLRKADDLVEETAVSRVSGLETWFELPGRTAPAPARWKMFLVTLAAIVPLVLLMNLTVLPLLSDWPLVVRTLVFSGTLTGLMTWVVMPRVTRLFRRFLYGSRA